MAKRKPPATPGEDIVETASPTCMIAAFPDYMWARPEETTTGTPRKKDADAVNPPGRDKARK